MKVRTEHPVSSPRPAKSFGRSRRKAVLSTLCSFACTSILSGCLGQPVKEPVSLQAPPDLMAVNIAPEVAVELGSMWSTTGCRLDHSIYRASDAEGPVQVVLAHGYRRERARMDGLARALAAAGLVTATIDLCNMFRLDVAHHQNAADMQALAERLAGTRFIYAGFSYGGLAAVLAAHNDLKSAGILALDLVDQSQIAERAASSLDRPMIGLFGDRSSCNKDNNGLAVMSAAPESQAFRIPGATHCDFEAPTDGLCRKFCGRDRSAASESQIRARIIDEAVQAAQRLIDPAKTLHR